MVSSQAQGGHAQVPRFQGQHWQHVLSGPTLLPEAHLVEVGLEEGGNFDFFLARY